MSFPPHRRFVNHLCGGLFYSSPFYPFSSAPVSVPPGLFCSIQQSDLSLINQAFFLFSQSFSGLEKELGRAWCLGCMEWMQLQKKKQDQTNFFEIHLTLLHVFYVLFHSDTWMGLGGTRTSNYSNSANPKMLLNIFV